MWHHLAQEEQKLRPLFSPLPHHHFLAPFLFWAGQARNRCEQREIWGRTTGRHDITRHRKWVNSLCVPTFGDALKFIITQELTASHVVSPRQIFLKYCENATPGPKWCKTQKMTWNAKKKTQNTLLYAFCVSHFMFFCEMCIVGLTGNTYLQCVLYKERTTKGFSCRWYCACFVWLAIHFSYFVFRKTHHKIWNTYYSSDFPYTHPTHLRKAANFLEVVNFLQYRHYYLRKLKYNMFLSEILKQNNDYSDTLDFGRG